MTNDINIDTQDLLMAQGAFPDDFSYSDYEGWLDELEEDY